METFPAFVTIFLSLMGASFDTVEDLRTLAVPYFLFSPLSFPLRPACAADRNDRGAVSSNFRNSQYCKPN